MDRNPEWIFKRWETAQADRAFSETTWDDIASVIHPARIGFVSASPAGSGVMDNIFDNTPMVARRSLANAIGSMLRPDGNLFSEIKPEDDALANDEQVAFWLSEVCKKRLMRQLDSPATRYHQAMGEADDDIVTFGWSTVYSSEAYKLNRLNFRCMHPKDVWIAVNSENRIDTVFRREKMTARQAAQFFKLKPKSKLDERARKLLDDNKPDDTVYYLNVVMPNDDIETPISKPVVSLWYAIDGKELVAEEGYFEMPYSVARWGTQSGQLYGSDQPGLIAVPDSNVLQAQGETMLTAAQRAADPTIMAPNDSMVQAKDLIPGGLATYDAELAKEMGGNPVYALDTRMNYPLSEKVQEATRAQVQAAFFKNVFNLPVAGPQMTAYEVAQRKEEFIREMGAVFRRLETDHTAPPIERGFMVMLRGGAFDPIPPQIRGKNVRFEYESPLKRMRQQIEAVAARAWMADIITVAQVDPGVVDAVDTEEYARFTGEATGVPKKLVRSPEIVNARRQQKQQAMQHEQQLATAERMAKAGRDAGTGFAALAKAGTDAAKAGTAAPAVPGDGR